MTTPASRATTPTTWRSALGRAASGPFVRRLALPVAGAAFVSVVIAWQVQLWNGGLRTPLSYSGDGVFYEALVKVIIDHGWYIVNPSLGAPHTQLLYDFPLGTDNLSWFAIRLSALVTHNPFLIINVFYYLTYPVIFLTAFFAFIRLRFSRATATAAAVIYALAPFHFNYPDIGHVMLAAYYAVPLACLLIYEILSEPPEHGSGVTASSAGARVASFVRSRWFWIPVVVGSAGVYYAFFFVFFALVAAFIGLVGTWNWRRLFRPLVCVGLTLVILGANDLPTLLYQARHGPNQVAGHRFFGESDLYGLRFADLVLPNGGSRLDNVLGITEKYQQSVSPALAAEPQGLGTIGAAGLIISVLSLLTAATRRRQDNRWSRLRRQSGMLNVVGILLATIGGGATFLGLFGLLQIRAYSRIVPFLAFFSLIALGTLLEACRERAPASAGWRGKALLASGVAAACVLAAIDQAPPVAWEPRRAAVISQIATDRRFATMIERRLGPKAMIFQLPLMPFPENIITDLPKGPFIESTMLIPYLYTKTVKWSCCQIKGRPQDLNPSFANRPIDRLLPDLAALGFSGIYIDRRGFADRGAVIEAEIGSQLRASPVASRDANLSFFDLRAYRHLYVARLPASQNRTISAQALEPLNLNFARGFEPIEGDGNYYPQLPGLTDRRWARDDAVVEVTNSLPWTRVLELHFDAALQAPAAGALRLQIGRARTVLPLSGPTPQNEKLTIRIPPGTTRIVFHTQPPGNHRLPYPSTKITRAFQLADVWWIDGSPAS